MERREEEETYSIILDSHSIQTFSSYPYEIKETTELGRFLVASKDLPARALIIQEKPMVCGPADCDERKKNTKKNEDDLPPILMCLGCFTQMIDNPQDRCSKCQWPACKDEKKNCEMVPIHAENECKLFQKHGIHFHCAENWGPVLYKSILVLRCYLLKYGERTKNRESDLNWNELLKFEHHNDIRATKPECVENDKQIIKNVKRFLNVSCQISKSTSTIEDKEEEAEAELDDLLRMISGVINVNAFTTVKENDEKIGKTVAQCIFRNCTLFNHSCIPNAMWCIGPFPDFQMRIRTTVPVKKGEPLTIPYSVRDNLYGTLQRLISTEDVAHFICQCRRCIDPTELKTFISAIKCISCQSGILLPINPVDPNSIWKCQEINNFCSELSTTTTRITTNKCQFVLPVNKVVRILTHIENQIDIIKRNFKLTSKAKAKSSKSKSTSEKSEILFNSYTNNNNNEAECSQLEELKEKCEKVLHKNHYLIQEICFYIVKQQAVSIRTLNEEQLKRFICYCDYLLAIANVLNPGYCRFRAFLQFYLSRALSVEIQRLQDELEEQEDEEELENEETQQDILNCYKKIQSLENEALLFFQSDSEQNYDGRNESSTTTANTSDCDTDDEKIRRKYYLEQIYSRIKSTQSRIQKLECQLQKSQVVS